MYQFNNYTISGILLYDQELPENTLNQVDNLLRQSVSPSEIIIISNVEIPKELFLKFYFDNFTFIEVEGGKPAEYYIFPISVSCQSEFIFILRKENFPNLNWLEESLVKSTVKDSIITNNSPRTSGENKIEKCQYGEYSLFFHKSYLRYYFMEDDVFAGCNPFIKFCFLAFAYGDKKTLSLNPEKFKTKNNQSEVDLKLVNAYSKRGWKI